MQRLSAIESLAWFTLLRYWTSIYEIKTAVLRLSPLPSTSRLKSRDDCLIYLLTLPGVKLNCVDIDGNSALHYAVINENPKMVYQLLMSSVQEDLVNNENYTAYQLALKTENRAVIGLFVV